MAAIGVVQPAFGRIVVEQGLSDAFRVSYHPDVYYHQLVEFRVYCYACRQTLLTSSSNPATFNLKALEDQDHPGPFEITAIVSGTEPPSPGWPYSIKVITSSSPAEAGTTNYQGGSYVYEAYSGGSQQITLRASQFSGYRFSYWRNDVSGKNVSSNPEFSFTGTCDDEHPNTQYRFTAVFAEAKPCNVSVDICSGSEGKGTVSGGGQFIQGETATLVAAPNTGYRFIGWSSSPTDPSKIVFAATPYNLKVTNDVTLYAVFGEGDVTISVRDSSNCNVLAKGHVSWRDGNYMKIRVPAGTEVTLVYDNKGQSGWAFDHWDLNGTVASTNPYYVFTAYSDAEFYGAEKYASSGTYAIFAGGVSCSVSGSGFFRTGEYATLTASVPNGFAFMGWKFDTSNPIQNTDAPYLSTTTTYRVACPGKDLYRFWAIARIIRNVSISAKKSADGTDGGGTVDGYDPSRQYVNNDELTITAVADDDFRFLMWSDGVTDATRTIKITSDLSLTAFFCSDMLMYDPSSGALLYAGNPLLFDGAIHVPPFES